MAVRRRQALLRLLDANANRALEGIRVCEEIARFRFESPRMFRRLRALRHAIGQAVRRLPVTAVDLVRARQSRRDLGRRVFGSQVTSLERTLLINFQRAKEALRTLEECTRLLAPRHTAVFQLLRFRTYEAERDALLFLAALRDH